MASLFDTHCTRDDHDERNHQLIMLRLQGDGKDFVADLAPIAKGHYIDPEIAAGRAEDLGFKLAAKAFRNILPTTKKARSGDLGEILGTEFVDQHSGYTVAIRRLRWRDGRESALRGDDFVGHVELDTGERFLKGEAKSRKTLGNATLDEATDALLANDGRPTPHSLLLIATHLREGGDTALAVRHELAALEGLKANQLEHLLFVVSGSDWEDNLKERLRALASPIPQTVVAVVVEGHQELIAKLYEALNG